MKAGYEEMKYLSNVFKLYSKDWNLCQKLSFQYGDAVL